MKYNSTPPRNSEKSETTDESASLLGKSLPQSEKINQQYSKPNYFAMFIWFCIGALFIFMALTSLPFIIIAPSGFNCYFSMASLCFLISVSFYHGPCVYFQLIFLEKATLPLSLLYVASTLSSLYCSFFMKIGYFYTLGLIGLQSLSVVFFVL